LPDIFAGASDHFVIRFCAGEFGLFDLRGFGFFGGAFKVQGQQFFQDGFV
jgi:hypothetical protein